MKLTLHIIKKDLQQFRWSLVLWLACFVYIFLFQERATFHVDTQLRDILRLVAVLTIAVFSWALLVSIIQQDHPTDTRAFWKTRPVSALRLVMVKLGLVLALFVGIPLLIALTGGWLQHLVVFNTLREFSLMVLAMSSVTLTLAAAASCTSNIVYALVLWFGMVFGSGAAAELLSRSLPKLTAHLAMQMNMNRIITLLVFSAVLSLAIILNQYLRRRLTTTILLLILASAGCSLAGVLWSYYYFYHG